MLNSEEWRQGVNGLVELLQHPFLLQRPLEFHELLKSINYNLALILKEKGETMSSFYFFLACYRLSPENISLIVELAMACRTQLLYPEALYFFQLAFAKDPSLSMRHIYLEQMLQVEFILQKYDECLSKVNYLLGAGFRKAEMSELKTFLQKELSPSSSFQASSDLFSADFDPVSSLASSKLCPASQSPYLTSLIGLSSSPLPQPSPLAYIKDLSSPLSPLSPCTLTLPSFQYRDLLGLLGVCLKREKEGNNVSNPKKRGEGGKDRDRDKDHARHRMDRALQGLLDCIQGGESRRDAFKVVVKEGIEWRGFVKGIEGGGDRGEIGESGRGGEVLEGEDEGQREGLKEEPKKEFVKEERNSFGQMSLREKKLTPPPQQNTASQSQTSTTNIYMNSSFDKCIHSILKSKLDSNEMTFFSNQISLLFEDSSVDLKSVGAEEIFRNLSQKAQYLLDDLVETPAEKSKGALHDWTDQEVSLLEQKDIASFYQNHLEGKTFTLLELIQLVLEHILSTKRRVVNKSGIIFEAQELEGPSPLLYFPDLNLMDWIDFLLPRFLARYKYGLSLDSMITGLEIMGQNIVRIHRDIQIKDNAEIKILREKLKKAENNFKSIQNELIQRFPNASSKRTNSEIKFQLFLQIRYQIQLLNTPNILTASSCSSVESEKRESSFLNHLADNLAVNMTKYFRLCDVEAGQVQSSSISEAFDRQFSLYWLDLGALSPSRASSLRPGKTASGQDSSITMKHILSMHNSQRGYKEFIDFGDSFSSFYERSFSKEEIRQNPKQAATNLGLLLHLFAKAFTLPGRTAIDDIRVIFIHLYKTLRLNVIIPLMADYFSNHLEEAQALIAQNIDGKDFSKNNEEKESEKLTSQTQTFQKDLKLLVYQLSKMFIFTLTSIDNSKLNYNVLFKLLFFCVSLEKQAPVNHEFNLKKTEVTDENSSKIQNELEEKQNPLGSQTSQAPLEPSQPQISTFRLFRLFHLLMHKDGQQSIAHHQQALDSTLKLYLLSNCLNLARLLRNKANFSFSGGFAKSAETSENVRGGIFLGEVLKELSQMFRCFYFIPLDSNRCIDVSDEEEDYFAMNSIPDYTILPGLDQLQESMDPIQPEDAQLFCEMSYIFFLSKMETNIYKAMKEKLDSYYRTKTVPALAFNKRQLLEPVFPSKLKKSLSKFVTSCFSLMKTHRKKWFVNPTLRTLKKTFPSLLDFRQDLLKTEANLLELDTLQPLERFKTRLSEHSGLSAEDLSFLSEPNLEVFYNILSSEEDMASESYSGSSHMVDYMCQMGDKLEIARLKKFWRSLSQIKSQVDRSSVDQPRSFRDKKLNIFGTSILMTFFLYFYDQENSGKILAEGTNLTESSENLSQTINQLCVYEQIGKITLGATGLIDSPVWFFYNFLVYIRVLLDQYVLFQTLSLRSHFSKDLQERVGIDSEVHTFAYSDFKLIVTALSLLESFNSEAFSLQLTDSDKVSLESSVILDVTEYLLLTCLLKQEILAVDLHLLNSVDGCITKCHDEIHCGLREFIRNSLLVIKKDIAPVKDDVKINYEARNVQYKSAYRKLRCDAENSSNKCREWYEMISLNSSVTSVRIDFLVCLYETKMNPNEISFERVSSVLERFKRLDTVPNRASEIYFYLNGLQPGQSLPLQEIDQLKNNYFLHSLQKLLGCLVSIVPNDLMTRVAASLSEVLTPGKVPLEEPIKSRTVEPSLLEIYSFVELTKEIICQLMLLVDSNPIKFDYFINFGGESDRLFSLDNYTQVIFDSFFKRSSQVSFTKIESTSRYQHHLKTLKAGFKPNDKTFEALAQEIADLIKKTFHLVYSSLLGLYSIYEKSKNRYKDSNFFLLTSLALKEFTTSYFENSLSRDSVSKFHDFLNDEYFNKNLDINVKFETDSKLGLLLNSPTYKANLRHRFFGLVGRQELETMKTFKKLERLAFKENNPSYLIFNLCSMEANINDLFRKVQKVAMKDIDLVVSENFEKNSELLSQYINDSEEASYCILDKKHYDIKSAKSLISFIKSTSKTDLFELVCNYLFELYSAICHLYSFTRAQKTSLCRQFQEKLLPADSNLHGLLEQPFQGSISGYLKIVQNLSDGLQTSMASQDPSTLLSGFKQNYLKELEGLLRVVLSEEYCSPDPSKNAKTNPFKVFDYIGKKKSVI